MKIALVITDYGSFNNFLGDLAIQLLRDGHEISVITSEVRVINIQDKFNYLEQGIKFFYVDFPRGFNPLSHYKSSKKIKKILDDIVPDLVHIHFTTGIFTTLFSGRLKYKTLGTFHGLGFPVLSGVKKQIFAFVERFCFNRLDKIYVLNEVDYKAVTLLGYDNVEKYETLGLGCDLSVFNPSNFSDIQKADRKKLLQIDPADFVFAYTGRFVSFKGFDKVIRSFLELYKSNDKVKLLLIGGNDVIHPTGLNEQELQQMGDCKGIIHIGFTIDVAHYLAITDAFVFPSSKEGMPVCVIEALAMGVPVITADSRGCNEIIEDNYNGYVVNVDENAWKDVKESMAVISSNPGLIERFRGNIEKDRLLYDRNRYVMSERKRYNELVS
ncbi:glycosyltransferase [Sphingobacterium hungaricum]|uniref:Uncharacterized protein n=1 Tax=Sphingobacterium hungaricum TaxID=2082723 RepID=A0A928YQM5_9SPHI|nr:glycosyltransferase [Sphingobacterium hungaricum]MBE8714119.1 hypothetical protein [Sphingobacterium hungaricum]